MREVRHWTAQSEATLQDALGDIDWDIFQSTSTNINEFADVTSSFIDMLVHTIIATATVQTFPNQKPWIDLAVLAALRA